MPLSVDIDYAARLVVTTASGPLHKADFVAHIENVWSDKALGGFDEIIDVSLADVSALSRQDLSDLANTGVSLDFGNAARLALCVSSDLGFGLGRMYSSMRETNTSNTREVMVFYDLESARAWVAEERARP